MQRHPNHQGLKTMLGIVLSRLERDHEAEAVLRSVLKRDPSDEQATSALGRLLDNSLRSEEAQSTYRALLQRKPESHVVLDDLCSLLLDEEEFEEAYKLAKVHAGKFPTAYEAYHPLQRVLQTEEDNIGEEIDESEFDRKGLTKLASNLIEQFEVVVKIEESVGSDKLNTMGHKRELDEEAIRIAAELDRIDDAFKKHRATMSPALQGKIQASHAEKGKRTNAV